MYTTFAQIAVTTWGRLQVNWPKSSLQVTNLLEVSVDGRDS